jgi:hypothetical protein
LNTFTNARARYERDRSEACIASAETLRPVIGVHFEIAEIGRAALDAVALQWGSSKFDWDAVYQHHRGIDAFKFAIWFENSLCGLGVATTSGQSVKLRFLEGSPDINCPLKGRRILIALDVAANYGQRRGKRNLILEPINETLIALYENVYGFKVVRTRKDPPYCIKGI